MAARPPPRPTEAWIRAVGARYLDRYAATEQSFRRWLTRKVNDAVRAHEMDPEEATRHVDGFVARMCALGVLNDERFAASKAATLRRRGQSARAVRQALTQKGVPAELADEALATLEATAREAGGEPELDAARTYARKHRMGPWRGRTADPEERRKELGRLGRKGYSFETARRVVDADE